MNPLKEQCLLIFAKPPIPGFAKTRLIPALGEQESAKLHGRLVLHTLSKVSVEKTWDVQLWCAGDIGHDFFQSCMSQFAVTLHCQSGQNLGERMFNAFEYALQNYKRVVVIGTDCPLLTANTIEQAFLHLEKQLVVINPAEDGGYVLLGLNKVNMRIFEDVSWGTSEVAQQTMSNLKQLDWKVAVLPVLWDVDLPQDLEKLAKLSDFTL